MMDHHHRPCPVCGVCTICDPHLHVGRKRESIAAGRSWPSLKASKTFDSEKLAESPLFERRLFDE